MFTKVLPKILVLCGLLAVIFFAVVLGSETSAPARAEANASASRSLVGAARYAGSDWIERHPTNRYAGSDWIERHPSNYYAGSDWIERHPTVVRKADYYKGSDWIERHPGNGKLW